MQTCEAALIGCDHPHSASHLDTLVSLTEVTGIHLWDPSPGAADALRERAGSKLVAVHADLDAVLSDGRIGWLLVGVRHDLFAGLLGQCAQAGKPVFAEKPLGLSRAEVAPVVAAFRERGLSLSVAFVNRAKPVVKELRRAVQAGWLGRLCSAETRLHTTTVQLRNPRHWLFDKALSGGGIIPWLGCHHLDLMRYVMGAEATSVTAQCATLSGEAISVEDMAVLTIGFDNGALATATFGYLMPGGGTGNTFAAKDTYFGLKGTLGQASFVPTDAAPDLDLVSFHTDCAGAPARRLHLPEARAKAYGEQPGLEFAREALQAALEGRDGPATGEDMLACWAIIEGAWQSSAEGVRVTL